MAKILILYYSTWGHVETMAQAVAEGARGVPGCTVDVLVPAPPALPVVSVELQAATIKKAAATVANRRPAYGDFIRVLSF